jgi:MFS family permease
MPSPRETRASLVAILSACIAFSVGMGLTLPLLSLILERRGVPGSINGLNLATAGLAAIVVTPFVPRMLKRFGTAQYLALCLAVAAAAMITLYEVPNLWLWFPVRFVLSTALNSLFVVSEFWINQLADERNRGRYIAIYATCIASGFGAGPALVSFIGTEGIMPFLCGAGLMLCALVPVLAARHAAPAADHGKAAPFAAMLRLAPDVFSAAFVYGAIDAGLTGLLAVYAVRNGYSEKHAVLVVTAVGVGSLLFQYPLGHLADRFDRRLLLTGCAIAGLAGAVLAPFAVAFPTAFYLLALFWGGIVLGIYTLGLTVLGERFRGPDLARANAGYVMSYAAGLLIGPAVEGVALDAWNPNGLMAALAAIIAAYLVFLMASRQRAARIVS